MSEHIIKHRVPGENLGTNNGFAEQIIAYRGRYDSVLGALASTGTEVVHSRTLETDPGVEPHDFVRHAVHVFVIPPQPVELHDVERRELGVLEGTAPNTLVREDQIADFDKTAVKATITVTYDDAINIPRLGVTEQYTDAAALNEFHAVMQGIIERVYSPPTTSH